MTKDIEPTDPEAADKIGEADTDEAAAAKHEADRKTNRYRGH